MNQPNPQEQPLGCFPYVIGGVSFIPLLGVPLGIIVVIWGIVKRKSGGLKLAALGACGILFTFILYGTLFYKGFVEEGGVYDDLKGQMAQTQLNDLIKSIEFFKIENGRYPHHLTELLPKEENTQSFTFIHEPFVRFGDDMKNRTFSYGTLNEGQQYYLFSAGSDQVPNTADDIFPVVSEEQIERIGYRKKQSKPVGVVNDEAAPPRD